MVSSVIAGFAVFCCLEGVQLEDLQWWLIPIFLLIPAIRLYAMDCNGRKWPLLQHPLCDNLLELLVITGLVLVAYTIALGRFSNLPLDSMTLEKLRGLEERVEAKHKYLEDHLPGFYSLLTCLIVVISFRVAAKTRPALRSAAARTTRLIATSLKWAERAGCAAAIAASLTFLATDSDAPLRRSITLSLKNATENYTQFRADLRQHVDIALRRVLIKKAWSERPREMREEITRAAEFYRKRKEFAAEQSRAADYLGTVAKEDESFPLAAEVPKSDVTVDARKPENDPPSPTWTPADLQEAAGEGRSLRAEEKVEPSELKDEDIEEIMKETFDQISPAENLFAQASVIELLKSHYPIFGEFVDAISSSITEAAFDRVRDSIVERIIKKRSAGSVEPVAQSVSEEVTNISSGPQEWDWSRFNESWKRTTETRLVGYGKEIATAESRLEVFTAQKQLELLDSNARAALNVVDAMMKVAQTTDASALAVKAVILKQVVSELREFGKTWPVLRTASAKEVSGLRNVLAQIDFSDATNISLDYLASTTGTLGPVKNRSKPTFGSPLEEPDDLGDLRNRTTLGRILSHPLKLPLETTEMTSSSPLQALTDCKAYGERKLLIVVATSTPQERQKLRSTMGEDYDVFEKAWQGRVKAEHERQVKIIQQQEEERKRVEQENWERREIEEPREIP